MPGNGFFSDSLLPNHESRTYKRSIE